jgi:hypothetical protein
MIAGSRCPPLFTLLCLCGIYEGPRVLSWDHKPKSPAVAGRRSSQRPHPLRGSNFALTRLLGSRVSYYGEWVKLQSLVGRLRCEKVVRILSPTDFFGL